MVPRRCRAAYARSSVVPSPTGSCWTATAPRSPARQVHSWTTAAGTAPHDSGWARTSRASTPTASRQRSGSPVCTTTDPERSAGRLRTIDGKRGVIPGDYARREEDGTVTVLGRGSVSINTGGEKVHPEEVEGVLLRHDDVFDAAVVGTPHERWGQQVTALVRRRAARDVSEQDRRKFCRTLRS